MFNKKFFLIMFSMLLFIAGGVQADIITIGSDADTWIQDAVATHGTDANMVLMGANTDYSGYVRFDLAAHNVISVEDATLTFTVYNIPKPPYRNDTVVGGRFSLYGLDNVAGNTPQNWDENTLNESDIGTEWSTNGGDPLVNVTDLDDDVEGITETVTNGPGGGWDMGTTITITGDALVSFLQSRIDDNGLATFILSNNDTADRGYGLGTKENDNEDVRPSIWSFSTEPFSIQIPGDRIIATADSNAPGQGPEQTINESGLDVNDLHSTESSDMWVTPTGQSAPVSIQYEFDRPYKLHQMLVWNYNGESILSLYGFKDVSVEYSVDGDNWLQLEGVSEFPRANGEDDYASGINVEFGGVAAKYVRITANSNWSNDLFDQYGLSEVRFIAIPVSAREPSPDDGATDVAIDTILGWKSGRDAVEHNVYLSNDQQSVTDGTAFVTTISQSGYGPLSLELGSTYYWQIDEVNNVEATPIWEGGIWSFTTQEYFVVDDFESYNDIAAGEEGSNLVYNIWKDGFDNPSTNGSTMGYFEAFQPSMETEIVHGGNQSVPVMYDNSDASSSTVTVTTSNLAIGRDWASVSPEFLSIWFYGDPNNAGTDQMFVEIDGSKAVYNGDLTQEDWQEWPIDLASLGINLSNVRSLTIGFERTDATGSSGMIFLDDIQLYTPAVLEQ